MSEQSSTAVARQSGATVERREKRTPDELIDEGKTQATALMKVVKEAGLSKDLGGNKPHLEVEAWQTIGRFNGYLTDIVWTRPVVEGGEKVAYEARAELVRIDDGAHLIGAEACCYFDEVIEKRDGTIIKRWDDDYAVRSMAQTRAQSKLGRMAFAWVAVLAGYSGTPAEEMEGVRGKGGRPVVFPFGKHQNKAPSDLTMDELKREHDFWSRKVEEETNPKFKASNQRLLTAIEEAVNAKRTPPPEAQASAATGEARTPDAVLPPGEEAISQVPRWEQAFFSAPNPEAYLAVWKSFTHQVTRLTLGERAHMFSAIMVHAPSADVVTILAEKIEASKVYGALDGDAKQRYMVARDRRLQQFSGQTAVPEPQQENLI